MFAAAGLERPQLETRKALLLIDLQKDFVEQAGKLFVPNTAEFLPKLPSLISKFRSKGDVFFIKTEFGGPRSVYSDATGGYGLILKSNIAIRQGSERDGDAGEEQHSSTPPAAASHVITGGRLSSDVEAFLTPPYNSQAPWSQCCVPNSPGASWADVLSSTIDLAADMEIVKSQYSPFQDASFLLHLRMQLITELYICGSLSNISVYATVIDAVSHGMSVTIVEDCVGYRDERCHREAMRQMADMMGANGVLREELMDDLAGLLGDVVHEEDYTSRYEVTFQHGIRTIDKPDSKQKTSAWLSSLEGPSPGDFESAAILDRSMLENSLPGAESSESAKQNTEPPPRHGPQRQLTPSSPPRKRQIEELESDARNSEVTNTRRCASHDGCVGDSPRVRPNRARRQRPVKESRRSPKPRLETRPNLESKSTGDIPLAATSAAASEPVVPSPNSRRRTKREEATMQAPVTSSPPQQRPLRRPSTAKKAIATESPGPEETIAADSAIIYDVLPEDLSIEIFDQLNAEVVWQKMHHCSGEVPRLVAVQGDFLPNKIPIYRHPADASPPLLPFTRHVQVLRTAAERLVGHPLNHVLIQLYRTPEDNISEHSDKTLDIQRGSKVVNYSAGALRTMIIRSKRSTMSTLDVDLEATGTTPMDQMTPGPPRPALRVAMPHNSLFVLGPATNQSYLHSIRADKRLSSLRSEDERAYNGSRISLTFRNISTFINPQTKKMWGQGASKKTEEDATSILEGVDAEKEYEKMIRAFGQENHRSSAWDWEEWYGQGFDVVDSPEIETRKDSIEVEPTTIEKVVRAEGASIIAGPETDVESY